MIVFSKITNSQASPKNIPTLDMNFDQIEKNFNEINSEVNIIMISDKYLND